MFGKTLVTKQTGAEGKPVNALLLCEKFEIKSERYFAILMDREAGGPLLIGSAIGGTSIEDIAAEDPSAIIKMPIDIMKGMSEADARGMAEKMLFTGEQTDLAAKSILNLYKVFIECDCGFERGDQRVKNGRQNGIKWGSRDGVKIRISLHRVDAIYTCSEG
jgi:succinyl-CoA synthetase beta subunit